MEHKKVQLKHAVVCGRVISYLMPKGVEHEGNLKEQVEQVARDFISDAERR